MIHGVSDDAALAGTGDGDAVRFVAAGDCVAVLVPVPVPLGGAWVPVLDGLDPVEAVIDGVTAGDAVMDGLAPVDADPDTDMDGESDTDGDADEPGDAVRVFVGVSVGLCEAADVTDGVADTVGVCDADWMHVPKLVRPHTHGSVSGIM